MLRRLIVLSVAMTILDNVAGAVEKYSIAREATLIVVGTLHPRPVFPWFDGWNLGGTIDVDEVLFGPRPQGPISYLFVCPYRSCRNWPPPAFTSFFTAKGMWFLRQLDEKTWKPSTGIGFVALWGRADYEDYIRRYK